MPLFDPAASPSPAGKLFGHHYGSNAGSNAGSSSSWLEPPNHSDQLLVLRHVCLENHRVHFFRNKTAAAEFDRLKEVYRVWQMVAPVKKAPPIWQFATVTHNASVARVQHSLNLSIARWVHETSFLWIPHKAFPINLFHFYNNFFLPLWLNVILSGSEQLAKRLFLFKLWPHRASDMLTKTQPKWWPHNQTHPAFVYVLHKLFREVAWPVEDVWAGGRAVCFRRLVWSQQLTTSRYPYQATSYYEFLFRNLSVATRARDAIQGVMGVPRPVLRLPKADDHRPSVVWISRQSTCTVAQGANADKGIGRCVRNLAELLETLRRSGRFGSVSAIEDFSKRPESSARDEQLRSQLEVLKRADVMIGLHGAGMAHTIYLENKSVTIELLDNFYWESRSALKIYSAMARVQGCGYTAADMRSACGHHWCSGAHDGLDIFDLLLHLFDPAV